jgi:hypothetical protein
VYQAAGQHGWAGKEININAKCAWSFYGYFPLIAVLDIARGIRIGIDVGHANWQASPVRA